MRNDDRQHDQLRNIKIEKGYLRHNTASVLIQCGHTHVLVAATVEEKVPPFKRNSNEGWLTAEYSMLPTCSHERIRRERNKVSGRTYEIQRLIGRSLRTIVDLAALGERTITIDADVLQADGGTRTASITAAYIALEIICKQLLKEQKISKNPLKEKIAAVSVGVVDGKPLLDLNYIEDSNADVDMNIIMTESGKIIEIQGTAEKEPFSKEEFDTLYSLAEKGIGEMFKLQS